jgi:hypothetical protein
MDACAEMLAVASALAPAGLLILPKGNEMMGFP